MGHTFTNLHYHFVFSTLDRRPLITDGLNEPIQKYMTGIIKNLRGAVVRVNSVTDHVHLLASLPADVSPAEAMRLVKTNTSKFVHESLGESAFGWQEGYGAFTVSKIKLPAMAQYVAGQQEHHRQATFEEEFLELLKRHGVNYDPNHMFD